MPPTQKEAAAQIRGRLKANEGKIQIAKGVNELFQICWDQQNLIEAMLDDIQAIDRNVRNLYGKKD